MTQRFSFWEDLSIAENLDFVARMYSLPNRKQAVRESIEQLGLGERRNSWPAIFPAAGNSGSPWPPASFTTRKLLLLDEPTAGVDPKARREFWEEIHRLAGEGLTFLITTHYMDEAERCHRLAFIMPGKLLATAPSRR